MINKYRLTSPAFEREKEEDKISPKKVYFIAVEGNITEVEYFDMINQHREELGIHSLITIEPLKRSNKDTNSDPMHVISLLRSRDFKTDPKDIIYDIGTNLGEFIDEIISYKI